MKRYQHKKNGRIIRVLEVFEKSGSMLVEFEDDHSTTNYSPSTIHRWWNEIKEEEQIVDTNEEDIVKEVMQQKKDLDIEVPPIDSEKVEIVKEVAGDGTSYKQVMNEILQDEKKAAEKKAKKTSIKKGSSREVSKAVPEILSYIEEVAKKAKAEGYVRDKQPAFCNYKFENTKVVFTTQKTKQAVRLYVKSNAVPDKYKKSLESVNGFFDKRLNITELTDDVKVLIDNIINSLKEEQK